MSIPFGGTSARVVTIADNVTEAGISLVFMESIVTGPIVTGIVLIDGALSNTGVIIAGVIFNGAPVTTGVIIGVGVIILVDIIVYDVLI
jgi:hypothetical protein